jgi:hypothetical protein
MNSINNKTSKKGLVDYLREVKPLLTGKKFKALADSVNYTLKKFTEDSTQVLKEDLMSLALDIQVMFENSTPAPVENSLKIVKSAEKAPVEKIEDKKPIIKKAAASDADTDKAVEELEKIAESGKPKLKKGTPKTEKVPEEKPVKKTSLVVPKANKSEKDLSLAENFPIEFKAEGVGKLKVNLEIKTVKDLFDAVQAGKNLVFAMYWTKRHLKQFAYDVYGINTKKFTEFPNDLDLAQLIYVSEEGKVAYGVSAYSEMIYSFLPADLELQDGLRFTNGVEYNIYEVIE